MMVLVQRAGRMAVDGWTKAVRVPAGFVIRALPDRVDGSWARASAEVTVDRAEAALREAVGGLLRDDELVADGRRRRIAAHERQRAIALRAEAEDERRAADLQLVAEREAAQRRRAEAERTAEQQRASAEREKAARERQARDTAAKQQRAVEAAKAEKLDAAEKREKRERLALLDDRLDGMEEDTTALTTADEAIRLRKAATAAKASRKKTG
jgi:hypothetical protein